MFAKGETVEFSGKAVANLAADPNMIKKTGKILLTTDLSSEYGFSEDDGSLPMSMTCMKTMLEASGHPWLAAITPSFLSIPKFIIHFGGFKF